MSVDRTAFRSERLPTEHFDRRFAPDNIAFWVPRLIEDAQIDATHSVLDVGCGTGGFARAIAGSSGAAVTGVERSHPFLEHARRSPEHVTWVEGDAEALPFADATFDRVLLSLVLHQLADPQRGAAEAARVLRPGGRVLVRTIAPGDAVERVPERFVPTMAEADRRRLPSLDTIEDWLTAAGFERPSRRLHVRNKPLDIDEEERSLRAEVAGRYRFVADEELERGVARMRRAAAEAGEAWVDPRPTWTIAATRRP